MQYALRMTLTALDAFLFGKPEVFVNFSAKKFDEKTLDLTDQPTIDMVKQQLAAFAKFIVAHGGKG
jgi:chromate reductase